MNRQAPESEPIAPSGTASSDTARYLNRDLQWLEFNRRVLAQAQDHDLPLLERARFLAIFSRNLDEFFMKRVGGLRRQIEAGVRLVAHEERSPEQLLWSIRERVLPLTQLAAYIYRKELRPQLRAIGVEPVRYRDLEPAEAEQAEAWYKANVFPLLTPLAVDPGHRFPFISNLSVSLGVMLRRPEAQEPVFARVKVPEVVDQWYRFDGSRRFVPIAEVIENNLDDLFPHMEILEVLPFRVTRNADLDGDDDDAEDLLVEIEQQLRERRFAPVVRLQIGKNPSPQLLQFLCEAMEIDARDIYESRGLINYSSLDDIADLPIAEHRFVPWTPVIPERLRDTDTSIFAIIRQGDLLVHHPYDSFDASVERFIQEAAADPDVLGIKQALYRTSGDSPFVHSLIHAAEAGKQVAVLVELRARFDEARNIYWARKLEDAGVHVAYGVVGLKTHTKITLVVRRDHDGLRCYAHIGTGNYHSSTARLYEDVGLLTCDPVVTDDVVDLFNYITGRSRHDDYNKLVIAPSEMKKRFVSLIRREIELHSPENPGRIVAKMNQLQDREIIETLYEASNTGVQIDLIVRGFCTLRPGMPGMSENIRVISIIGQFLEHSRIFWFKGGRSDPLDGDFFIGSADWMYRNLHNRVEAAVPIEQRALRERLWKILEIGIEDRRLAWELQPDGLYTRRLPTPEEEGTEATQGTHQILMQLAHDRVEAAASGA